MKETKQVAKQKEAQGGALRRETPQKAGKGMARLLVFLFCGLLLAFGTLFLLTPDRLYSEQENRYLTQRPDLNGEAFFSGRWMEETEDYINDQFPLRDRWIVARAALQKASGRQDNNGVYFPAGEGAPLIETFWDYDRERYLQNLAAVESYEKAAAEAGEQVYFLPVPNAVAVVAKRPASAPDMDQEWLLEEMAERLAPLEQQGEVHFVESLSTLREGEPLLETLSLQEEGAESSVYYRTDHHLNMYGSYLLYRRLAESMGLVPLEPQDFEVREAAADYRGTLYSKSGAWWTEPDRLEAWAPNEEGQKKILASMQGQSAEEVSWTVELPKSGQTYDSLYNDKALGEPDRFSFYAYGNQPLLVIRRNAEGERGASLEKPKKLLIIKDSYAHQLLPFLACHFDEIHVLDLRYYRESVSAYKRTHEIRSSLILYNLSNFCQDADLPRIAQ